MSANEGRAEGSSRQQASMIFVTSVIHVCETGGIVGLFFSSVRAYVKIIRSSVEGRGVGLTHNKAAHCFVVVPRPRQGALREHLYAAYCKCIYIDRPRQLIKVIQDLWSLPSQGTIYM